MNDNLPAQRESDNLPAVARPADTDSWIEVVESVAALAARIAGTPFVPKDLRGSAPSVAAAILYGREVGLPPMTALTQTHVIEGKPAASAEAMRALILAAGHELEVVEATGSLVTMRARRRGAVEWTPLSWSLDMAKAAGIANKQVWKSYPRAMLAARCTAELARLVFPDVIHGMRAIEELDEVEETGGESTSSSSSSTKVSRSRSGGTAPRRTGTGKPAASTSSTPSPGRAALPPLPGEEEPPAAGPDVEPPAAGPDLAVPVRHEDEVPVEHGGETPRPRCEATHPELGRCVLEPGHEGDHEPEHEIELCPARRDSDGAPCRKPREHDGRHYYGRDGDDPGTTTPDEGSGPSEAAQEPEEVVDGELVDEEDTPPDTAAGEPITKAQQRMMLARLSELGLDSSERDERLLLLSRFVDRELSSSNDLGKAEAARLLDTLSRVNTLRELLEVLDGIEAARG